MMSSDSLILRLILPLSQTDFGGEVERVLNMADGVLLVVDSVEGPKPQTRFVLDKALRKGLKALVVVNKIDRPAERPEYVVDKVFDLMVELNADDEQCDFKVVYASGLLGKAGTEPDSLSNVGVPDWVLDVPQMLLSSPLGLMMRLMLQNMQMRAPPVNGSSLVGASPSFGQTTSSPPSRFHFTLQNLFGTTSFVKEWIERIISLPSFF
jgi:hypothetical protein